MTVPRISVVVPFHNNEDLLDECLRSIAAQTFTDLEVIMVDDGSTDGSSEIAAARAAADPRFTLVQVPNGGPGYARNRGVERATGEFLAFVDADDALPRHAYEKMLHTLEQSGSDFASGHVQRIGPMGITVSALHARAIKGRRIGTHISRTPALFYDISVWNKLFRKSFWDARHLTYPEGMVWEDIQLMTRAHVLARAVDVLPEPVYFWRERDKGALSITQSRTDISNFRDRITALLAIDAFLRRHKPARLLRQHQTKALVNDIWLYVREIQRTSDSFRAEFIELTAGYLAQVDKRVFRTIQSWQKLAYHLIAQRQLPELIEFMTWRSQQPNKTVPVIRKMGRLTADLPFRGDSRLGVPDRVYRPHWRELDPFVRVEGVTWEAGSLVITGCAYVPSVDVTKRQHTSKVVVLRPRNKLRPPLVIPARSFRHEGATAWSRQDRYDYDWAGFRCAISPRLFRAGHRWLTGDWDCFVLVRGRGVWRPARLHTPTVGPAERPAMQEVAPGVRFGARWIGRHLHIQVIETPAVLRSCGPAGDGVTISVEARLAGGEEGAGLALAAPIGTASRKLAATREALGDGRVRLRATITGADLAQRQRAGHGPEDGQAHAVEWDLYVTTAGQRRVRVAFAPDCPELISADGGREIAVERTRYGNAIVVHRAPRPVIQGHSWSATGTLTLRGTFSAHPGQEYEVLLLRKGSTDRYVVPMARSGEAFTITIDATAMPSFGWRLPLRDGSWDLAVRRPGQPDADLVVPAYDHARLPEPGEKRQVFGPKGYRFTTSGYDVPILTVGTALKLTEDGRVQRRMLRGVYYPLQQKLPLRDAALFISWKGKACTDNPRAIADELRRRGDDREHLWAVNDWSVPLPDGATGVLTGTEDYFEALARARYLISNDDMTPAYAKRDGQVYVQTWHGTPLKRIGFDVDQPQFMSGTSYLDHLARDVAKWDLLLSPNPFSTPIMQRAFRYDGEICESGYPRNDLLCSPDTERIAEQVRARLGIPAGKRVVMYAPTWRDNQYYASGRYRFDFRLDLERAWRELGDGYVILLRGHHHMADDVPAGTRPGFVINVTRYPEITDLFLVSDAIITDYSSVMFDFAPTGRPMLFYTYDLEQYRDKLRGFYFDFQAEAPGPLLATSAEVVESIGDLDGVAARYRQAYAAFQAKFCQLDDGKAAARACDRIFGT